MSTFAVCFSLKCLFCIILILHLSFTYGLRLSNKHNSAPTSAKQTVIHGIMNERSISLRRHKRWSMWQISFNTPPPPHPTPPKKRWNNEHFEPWVTKHLLCISLKCPLCIVTLTFRFFASVPPLLLRTHWITAPLPQLPERTMAAQNENMKMKYETVVW